MPNAVVAKTLTLDIERKGAHTIVHCRGRLVYGGCHLLFDQVRELLPESKCVTLDLTDLKYVDSMGLGTLVRLHVSAKAAGSRIQLINLGKQVRALLGITNLLSLFGEMCENGVALKF
jgi:anti-sigma B factor antagonist